MLPPGLCLLVMGMLGGVGGLITGDEGPPGSTPSKSPVYFPVLASDFKDFGIRVEGSAARAGAAKALDMPVTTTKPITTTDRLPINEDGILSHIASENVTEPPGPSYLTDSYYYLEDHTPDPGYLQDSLEDHGNGGRGLLTRERERESFQSLRPLSPHSFGTRKPSALALISSPPRSSSRSPSHSQFRIPSPTTPQPPSHSNSRSTTSTPTTTTSTTTTTTTPAPRRIVRPPPSRRILRPSTATTTPAPYKSVKLRPAFTPVSTPLPPSSRSRQSYSTPSRSSSSSSSRPASSSSSSSSSRPASSSSSSSSSRPVSSSSSSSSSHPTSSSSSSPSSRPASSSSSSSSSRPASSSSSSSSSRSSSRRQPSSSSRSKNDKDSEARRPSNSRVVSRRRKFESSRLSAVNTTPSPPQSYRTPAPSYRAPTTTRTTTTTTTPRGYGDRAAASSLRTSRRQNLKSGSRRGRKEQSPVYRTSTKAYRAPSSLYHVRGATTTVTAPSQPDFVQSDQNIYVPLEYDEEAIPGEAGVDYPVYQDVPDTRFACSDQEHPGLYADIEAQCQTFHICQEDGRQDSFLCPNGTVFNQQYFVCDWWYNFSCDHASRFYSLNALIYEIPDGARYSKK